MTIFLVVFAAPLKNPSQMVVRTFLSVFFNVMVRVRSRLCVVDVFDILRFDSSIDPFQSTRNDERMAYSHLGTGRQYMVLLGQPRVPFRHLRRMRKLECRSNSIVAPIFRDAVGRVITFDDTIQDHLSLEFW
jgi:hypothetical protein